MLPASMLSWYSIGPFLKHVLTDKYQILLKYRKIRLIYPSNAIEISSAQSRTHRSDKKGLRASLRFSVSCLEEGTASPRNIAYAISKFCRASLLSPCRVCAVNSLFTVSIPKRDTSSCHLRFSNARMKHRLSLASSCFLECSIRSSINDGLIS